jgi:pseudaminic acid cytidylyltransferase
MATPVIEILEGHTADYVCMAYACAPFITADLLREADTIVKGGEIDCVFPIYRAEPIERAQIIVNTKLMSRFPEYDNVNSQAFPTTYHSTGMFYFCDAKKVLEYRTVMLPRRWGIIVPEAIDIDTEEDLTRAEKLYKMAYGI